MYGIYAVKKHHVLLVAYFRKIYYMNKFRSAQRACGWVVTQFWVQELYFETLFRPEKHRCRHTWLALRSLPSPGQSGHIWSASLEFVYIYLWFDPFRPTQEESSYDAISTTGRRLGQHIYTRTLRTHKSLSMTLLFRTLWECRRRIKNIDAQRRRTPEGNKKKTTIQRITYRYLDAADSDDVHTGYYW